MTGTELLIANLSLHERPLVYQPPNPQQPYGQPPQPSLRGWVVLVPLVFVSVAGCATEPELNDDYATYEVSAEPVPLTPIPGADITAWTEAIETLGLGEWSSSGGLITDAYEPARSEPQEDPRIEADRYSWGMEGTLPHGSSASFTFIARAVTDAEDGVLSIACDADYDVHAEDLEYGETSIPLDEVRRAMLGCMSGSGNEAISSDELTAWMAEQLDAAQAAYDADEGRNRFQVSNMIDAENVLVWFGSNEGGTSVSLSVDPRAATGSP